MTRLESARAFQIKAAAALVRRMPHTMTQTLRNLPFGLSVYNALLGYRRPFETWAECENALATFTNEGHENEAAITLHLEVSTRPRCSDYPAMFHLAPLIKNGARVFDLGGNVGNLFYCYRNHLALSDVVWQILDLPKTMQCGQELAMQRKAYQITFVKDWLEASGADILIASGSIHYFDNPFSEMVSHLPEKPQHILLNRSPLVKNKETYTVQDAGLYKVACKLYKRDNIISEFCRMGYRVVNIWSCRELSLSIPGYPEFDVPAYTGMYLTKS